MTPPELNDRERRVLEAVIQSYVETAEPAGSRNIARRFGIGVSPATVRNTMSDLEEKGFLFHPHTSAGRVPTDVGYRRYVDELLEEGSLPVPRKAVELTHMRREVDEAMRATTEQLSQVTNLLALVSAPPIETSTIRRVEVLLLQPQVLMIVVITSTGGVTKRVVPYPQAVDPGLVAWAGSYLNEVLGGMDVGARMIGSKLVDPGLGEGERAFLQTLAPVFTELEHTAGDTLFVDGAARLLSEHRFQELSQLGDLMDVLEQRVAFLSLLRESLEEPSVYLRIGHENPRPELRSLSIVAANYGLARRNLGAVSVVGPVRMDYPRAIIAVRQAASELSRFVAEVYDE
jgi:heat-inducible transcriptional repressor